MGLLLGLYELLMFFTFLFLMALAIRGEREVYESSNGHKPRVLVIVPCRGMDIGLARNLRSMKGQDYGNFQIVAVVDDPRDEAAREIRKAGLNMLVTNPRFKRGSGKVNAIASAISANRAYNIYVIADSDIHVKRDWLSLLVVPLADRSVGISTTYPYFRPMGGLWPTVKSVWSFVGEGLMESRLTRFGWGGSLAFRAGILNGRRFRIFSGCVSDDIPITNMAKAMGYRIAYVKAAQPVVDTNDDLRGFWEWSNRQTAFSVIGFSRIFAYGVVFYTAQVLLLLSSIALAATVSGWFLVLLLPFAMGMRRTYARARERRLESALVYILINFIYLANLLVAVRMRQVRWRGRSYDITHLSRLQSGF
ncbi:MAG: glycosyltransferase family 2 protein [Candidatus Micrarchaeota archaeon]|nr:glycosyltransferase family 2 protein [Candidatus Micrarchaeota archaeon]